MPPGAPRRKTTTPVKSPASPFVVFSLQIKRFFSLFLDFLVKILLFDILPSANSLYSVVRRSGSYHTDSPISPVVVLR